MATKKAEQMVLYRAKYTVEIEITDPKSPLVLPAADYEKICRVTLEHSKRFPHPNVVQFKDWDEERFEKLDYVEKNFPKAVASLWFRMQLLEAEAFRPRLRPPQFAADMQRKIIKLSGSLEQKRIREQNPGRRLGRNSKKDTIDYQGKQDDFVTTFTAQMEALSKKGDSFSFDKIAEGFDGVNRSDRNRGMKMKARGKRLGIDCDELRQNTKKIVNQKN